MLGVAVLLLAAVGGYMVFERASTRKGSVKTLGRVVGVAVIILSFLGVACRSYSGMSGTSCALGGGYFKKGVCPYAAKAGKAIR